MRTGSYYVSDQFLALSVRQIILIGRISNVRLNLVLPSGKLRSYIFSEHFSHIFKKELNTFLSLCTPLTFLNRQEH